MEFECVCGATLLDMEDSLTGKGFLLSEGEYHRLLQETLTEFRAFFAADTDRARDEWMSRHFGLQWRRQLSDAEHLEAFVHAQIMGRARLVYECPECGRLLIDAQVDDTVQLVAYRPDQEGSRRMLAARNPGDAP
jgi:hypothetical protein